MTAPASPYRGIEPFRYADRGRFFGRETLVDDLLANILAFRLVILFGESGAGKSSLINAGLMPRLEQEGWLLDRLRVGPSPETPLTVERTACGTTDEEGFRPSAFDQFVGDDSAGRTIPLGLAEAEQAIRNRPPTAPRVVLVFDQFEELFTRLPGRHDIPENGSQAALLDMVVGLLKDASLRVKVVISIREDYLAKLEEVAQRYPQVFQNRLRLRALESADARRAVLGPFGDGRIEATNPYPASFTSALADEIVRDLAASGTDRLIHPTELQIVCLRLWEQFASKLPAIDVPQYELLGRVTGILEGFLAGQLLGIPADSRDRAVRVLGNLITEAATRDLVSEGRLRTLTNLDQSTLADALDGLARSRLVHRVEQRKIGFWEVTSEYLIAPIQKAAVEAFQREEAAQALRHAERERQLATTKSAEADRYRRLFLTTATFCGIALMLVVAIVYLYLQMARRQAEAEQLADKVTELEQRLQQTDARLGLAEGQNQQLQRELTAAGTSTDSRGVLTSANIAIGFSAIILVFGIGVSGVTTAVTSLANARGRHLRTGIAELLRELDGQLSENGAHRIATAVLIHPLIRDPFGRIGAHVTRDQFIRILLELAAGTGTVRLDAGLEQELRTVLNARGIGDSAAALQRFLNSEMRTRDGAPSLPFEFSAQIRFWFDRMIDQARGRFVRTTGVVTLLVATLFAVFFQLDAFNIVNWFSADAGLRRVLALQAERQMGLPGAGWPLLAGSASPAGSGLSFSLFEVGGILLSAMFLTVAAFVWYNAADYLLTSGVARRRPALRRV